MSWSSRSPALLGCSLALLSGCAGSSSPEPAVAAATPAAPCSQTLVPRAAPRTGAPRTAVEPPQAIAPAPPSRLIVEARLPLARLTTELEQAVSQRLAEASGVRLGAAGVLRYSVDRGPFSLTGTGAQLVIETALQGSAEACSGSRCYASCEPRALARAEIPLWLSPDYRFERSQVSLQFTRGCKVRALGGLFSLDVTPLLKTALAPQLERVRREIDSRLPDLRAHAQRAWRQLSAPRSLPLAGCVVLAPVGLVQGPMTESAGVLQARFALLARPELRTDCSTPPASAPLPPLGADPSLPSEDQVTLGMEVPLTSLARAFEAPAVQTRLQVATATVRALGSGVSAELELRGELCGSVALQAEPAFSGEEGSITLTAGKLDPEESARVRAAGADPTTLARQLTQLPRLSPPIPLSLLRAAPPALASLLSDPELALSAQVSSLRAAGAAIRGEQLVAWVEARGSLLLEPRLPAPR